MESFIIIRGRVDKLSLIVKIIYKIFNKIECRNYLPTLISNLGRFWNAQNRKM